MSAGRLGALDGLQRGILSLRANWELIPLVWLQTVLLAALGAASLLPFALVLDLELPDATMTPDEGADWMMEMMSRVVSQAGTPAFWLAVAASSAVAVALFACYSFFQAGVVGVFTVADRQAPPGRPTPAAWYRTYSWADFQGWGGRMLWPFFWLVNLVLLFWLLWSLLAVLALLATGLVAGAAGFSAAVALGCASVPPMLFLLVVLVFWAIFAQAVLAERGCGVWESLRIGLGLVVRRLGAVTLLFLVMAVTSVSVGLLFLAVSLPLSLGVLPAGVESALTIVLQLLQWLVSAVIQLTLVAAVVGITRGELAPREAESVDA